MEKTLPLSFHKHLSLWLCVPGKEKCIRDHPWPYGAHHLLGDTDSSDNLNVLFRCHAGRLFRVQGWHSH